MRHLLFAAVAMLAAATCRHGDPTGTGTTPDPTPIEIPDSGDDAGEPVPTPSPVPDPTSSPDSTCEAVFDHLADIEAPPADGHDAFLKRCAGFSSSALSCLLATDTPAVARACLEH